MSEEPLARPASDELHRYIGRFSDEVAELFLAVRGKVLAAAPEATEIVTNASYTVACGFTFTHSVKQAFVYVGAYTKHVNLGFCFGASMHDPEGRLKGDGNSMRHVSFTNVESVEDRYIEQLVRQAIAMAQRPNEPLLPKTVITKMKKDALSG